MPSESSLAATAKTPHRRRRKIKATPNEKENIDRCARSTPTTKRLPAKSIELDDGDVAFSMSTPLIAMGYFVTKQEVNYWRVPSRLPHPFVPQLDLIINQIFVRTTKKLDFVDLVKVIERFCTEAIGDVSDKSLRQMQETQVRYRVGRWFAEEGFQ